MTETGCKHEETPPAPLLLENPQENFQRAWTLFRGLCLSPNAPASFEETRECKEDESVTGSFHTYGTFQEKY